MDIGECLPAAFSPWGRAACSWWQWGALPLVVLAAIVLGLVLGRLSRRLIGRYHAAHHSRPGTTGWSGWSGGPLYWFWGIIVARMLVAGIGLPGEWTDVLERSGCAPAPAGAVLGAAFVWSAWSAKAPR